MTAFSTNSSTIEIHWSAIPAIHVNAQSLLGYRVYWKTYNETEFTVNDTTHLWFSLTRLQHLTQYEIVILAYNMIGAGPNTSLSVRTDERGRCYINAHPI